MNNSFYNANNGIVSRVNDIGHFYYNAVIDFDNVRNPAFPHRPIPAIYDVQPSQAILDNPKDFYMSIVRFQVPTQLIPLYFEVGYSNGVSPNLSFRSVTIQVGPDPAPPGNVSQTFLIYVPHDTTIPVPSPPIDQNNIAYYGVQSFQQLVNEINVALATSFAALVAVIPVLVPPIQAPYMIYDSVTELFSLIVDQRFVTNDIRIYFNTDLYLLFQPSFQVQHLGDDTVNGKDFQIIIQNERNNAYVDPAFPTTPFYQIQQEFKTIDNIAKFRAILILMNNVQLRTEATPQFGQSTTYNSLPIASDFLVPLVNDATQIRTYVTYLPTAQYRLIDLLGTNPITRIQLQIFWTDNYDNIYPLLIPAHDRSSIKIMFTNRNLYVKNV